MSNIEKSRVKIRQDLLEARGGDQLSHSRRLAISSIKERIDQQAMILEKEETVLKERGDYYRRKEDKLRVMRQKLDILEGNNKFEDTLSEE